MQGVPENSDATVTARLRSKRQRGSAIVEQALVLPIMLAVLFGAIDMSRALYTYHYVSYIAREATRWASVRSKNSFNGGITQTDIQTYVSNVSGMGLDKNQITSSLSYIAPSNPTPLCPGGTTDSTLNNKPGCVVQVTVNYNYTFLLPFLPKGAFTMSSESQMVITQ
jgi:Flp pilus assembly protein TadG